MATVLVIVGLAGLLVMAGVVAARWSLTGHVDGGGPGGGRPALVPIRPAGEPDADELARILPDKSTRVLIYCNNNFLNAPGAFPSKAVDASLNIYTYNVLHSYGYENIYELGPLLYIRQTKIVFEGSEVTL